MKQQKQEIDPRTLKAIIGLIAVLLVRLTNLFSPTHLARWRSFRRSIYEAHRQTYYSNGALTARHGGAHG
jgi:hypothetical protein